MAAAHASASRLRLRGGAAKLVRLVAVCAVLGTAAWSSSALSPFSGSLAGFVGDTAGVPQMGAAVLLYNHQGRLVERAYTNKRGAFGFASLVPGFYSIRVNLSSFVPAYKQNVSIRAGARSFLSVNLSSVLSSIELIRTMPGQSAIMSDDWKWVLRSAPATRPVLRLLPEDDFSRPEVNSRTRPQIFSDTHGLVRFSAGDGTWASSPGSRQDLGTAFALATSLLGGNQIQISGNMGFELDSGLPTGGFRTSYSRTDSDGLSPELNLTMRQAFLPARVGAGLLAGKSGNTPVLQSLSLSMIDHHRLTDELSLDYGVSLESVAFLSRLNFASPFARVTYQYGGWGTFEAAYSSGFPPLELTASHGTPESDLQQDLTALAAFPRIALRGGRATVQRSENFELGYSRAHGGRVYSVGIFRESVLNASLLAAVPAGYYPSGELLPDIASNASIFNAGSYRRMGYLASLSQALGEDLSVALAVGSGGALLAARTELRSANPEELRNLMRVGNRKWAALRVAGQARWTGTRFSTGYQWTDYRYLVPGHLYLTQKIQPEAGLNVFLRQPVPALALLNGRLEASAELRNLLAQGYLPITTSDGRRLYLIQSPRALRGGLSFIF